MISTSSAVPAEFRLLGHFNPAVLIQSAMPGYANIFLLGAHEGTYGRLVGEYQFTYNEAGKSWVRTFDNEASLAEFLRSDIAVPTTIVDLALDDLRREGKATLADVAIRESEAPAMGLEQLPTDD